MGIKIIAVGGYSEVGRNMTAVVVDDEVVILDMGVFLPAVIDAEEEIENFTINELRKIKAIPDDTILDEYRKNVKAIIFGHAHLDHVGAAPYMLNKYKVPIIGTPFTINVLKRIIKDKGKVLTNKTKSLNIGGKLRVSKNIEVEFVNMTHSTAQCAMVYLKTKYGRVAYCLDYKLDNSPTLGGKPDYEKIRKYKDVKCLILDSLDSKIDGKTPSEMVAKQLLTDVLLNVDNRGKGILVTTFSSHIARLKSITELGRKLGRRVVFLGRSLNRYVQSAKDAKVVNFNDVEVIAYRGKIAGKLKEISKNPAVLAIIAGTANASNISIPSIFLSLH